MLTADWRLLFRIALVWLTASHIEIMETTHTGTATIEN